MYKQLRYKQLHVLLLVLLSGTASGNYTWTNRTTSTTKPSSRSGHTSIVYNGQMVMFAGRGYESGNIFYNDVWTLNLTSYVWKQLTTSTTKPGARDQHSSILYDEQMVVFGGDSNYVFKNDVWTLNLTSYIWKQLTTSTTKPGARDQHSSILYDKQMVVFGGDGNVSAYNDVWTLNLTSHKWAEVTTSRRKPSARLGHSSVVYDGQMVMFGGQGNGGVGTFFKDVWTLNLTSYDWTNLITSTTNLYRQLHSSIIYGGQMIMFGGWDSNETPYNDVWSFNLTSYDWTELRTSTTKLYPREDHSSVLYREKMVVFGGIEGAGGSFNDVWTLELTDVKRYTPSRNTEKIKNITKKNV
jgi:Rab9 effector protein with kelch motifs